MNRLVSFAALSLFVVACRSMPENADAWPNGPADLAGHPADSGVHDFAVNDFTVYDFASNDFTVYDFASNDLAYHPYDFASHPYDLAHPPVQDFAQPVLDLAHPPDFAVELQACEACLQMTCSSQAQTCEADPSCTTTLSCAVGRGCFTYASGSQTFASCVEQCANDQGLSLGQEAQALAEIAALATCGGSCIGACGGN